MSSTVSKPLVSSISARFGPTPLTNLSGVEVSNDLPQLLSVQWRVMKTFALAGIIGLTAYGADLRIGIVGTDTSHVTAFTKMLNDAAAPDHVAGARVVAAYKGGSPD